MSDPADHRRMVKPWGQSKPTRTIVVGDRIAGFWELDPDRVECVTFLFDSSSAKIRQAVQRAGVDVARFLVKELGHGRCFALDSDDAVRERAASVRAMVK